MAERRLLRLSTDRRATRGAEFRPGVETRPALVTVSQSRGWRHSGIGRRYKHGNGLVGVFRRYVDDEGNGCNRHSYVTDRATVSETNGSAPALGRPHVVDAVPRNQTGDEEAEAIRPLLWVDDFQKSKAAKRNKCRSDKDLKTVGAELRVRAELERCSIVRKDARARVDVGHEDANSDDSRANQ